jgi:uncharacterized protein (DUF1800 family)
MALTLEQVRRAHLVLNRFGLGAKPGAITRIGLDPKAALLAEINTPGIATLISPNVPGYVAACRAVDGDFDLAADFCERELWARMDKHMLPEIGFVERLVLFFSNHFSISINKDGAPRPTIGHFERAVIRRNVLGSFEQMLQGAMMHPAMLDYLDNSGSVGPNSPYGKKYGDGLNENLGREVLELHTLGVGGGYSQADVTAMAKVLTGWTVVRNWEAEYRWDGATPEIRGQFFYRTSRHEPAAQRIMGVSYPNTGIEQARAVLKALALHPKTAEFIAFKLVRHFLTDQPTPAMVEPLKQAYLSSKGNLKAVALALIELPEAFSLPLNKLRTPYELQIAQMRATERRYARDQGWAFYSPLWDLRNLPWERRTPDGYPDDSDYWLSPDGMRVRLETARLHAWGLQSRRNYRLTPAEFLDSLFGRNGASAASRAAVTSFNDTQLAMATLFMLPEFQWR